MSFRSTDEQDDINNDYAVAAAVVPSPQNVASITFLWPKDTEFTSKWGILEPIKGINESNKN